MSTLYTQISSKGQVVIPSSLREEMNLSVGTKIAVERDGNAIVLRPITEEFIRSLRGCTRGAGAERERTHRDDEQR